MTGFLLFYLAHSIPVVLFLIGTFFLVQIVFGEKENQKAFNNFPFIERTRKRMNNIELTLSNFTFLWCLSNMSPHTPFYTRMETLIIVSSLCLSYPWKHSHVGFWQWLLLKKWKVVCKNNFAILKKKLQQIIVCVSKMISTPILSWSTVKTLSIMMTFFSSVFLLCN